MARVSVKKKNSLSIINNFFREADPEVSMPPSPIIFYADDDSDDRTWVKEFILKKEPSSEVKEFEDGSQLLAFLRKTPDVLPHLIILDINMPVMSGKEVLQELRKHRRWQSLKVVMFTNSGADVDRQFAQSLNAHFITKPMSIDGIRQVTERFLTLCSHNESA